jgi:hypothetical protein
MTSIVVIVCVLFGVTVYAIHKGYGVKTVLKLLGLSMTFEAQKQHKSESTPDLPVYRN